MSNGICELGDYREVPVGRAQLIAADFLKDQVVIVSYDRTNNLTHTTTWGWSAIDKEQAAAAGKLFAKTIGCDLSQAIHFEDFHKDYKPACYREAVELLGEIHATGALLPEAHERVGKLLEFIKTSLPQAPLETSWHPLTP